MKPLPKFLLNHNFFKDNLCSSVDLHANACGLLHSYTNLVQHRSDFKIAVELGLLPEEIEWGRWMVFVGEIQEKVNPDTFRQSNHRYAYGELRLARLNLIYRLACGQWIRGYHNTYNEYGNFFKTNFAWVLILFAYASVVLSAMQVGLVAQQGPQDGHLGRTSFGFSVAVLVVVGGVVGLIGAWFIFLFVSNLVATLVHEASVGYMPEQDAVGEC